MNDTEIIAYHGWGFDAKCWQPIESGFSNEITWKNFDRGYFGKKNAPTFSDTTAYKAIATHSFGLHHCPPDQLKEADLVIIIAGFLHFHPKAAQFRRRSKLVLKEMISRFEEEPHNVLKTFYRNVFHPRKTFTVPDNDLNYSLLLDDLVRLNESEIPLPDLKKSAAVCIFQGADDAIVPKEKSRGLYEQFGDKAQYFEVRDAGHALPITHAPKCREILKPMLKHIPEDA